METDSDSSSVIQFHAVRMVANTLEKYYGMEFPELRAEPLGDVELEKMLKLVLGCLVQCTSKEKYIGQIMGLEEGVQRELMVLISEVMQDYPSSGVENTPCSPTAQSPAKTAPITPAKLLSDSDVQDITIRAHKMQREINALKEERDDFAKTAEAKSSELKREHEKAEKIHASFDLQLLESKQELKELECKYQGEKEQLLTSLQDEQEKAMRLRDRNEAGKTELFSTREENARLQVDKTDIFCYCDRFAHCSCLFCSRMNWTHCGRCLWRLKSCSALLPNTRPNSRSPRQWVIISRRARNKTRSWSISLSMLRGNVGKFPF